MSVSTDKNTVPGILRPGGVLSRALPSYEPREGQLHMAEAVGHAIESETHLVVEAGTGTGKTFAYLLPAITSGIRVVISTGTLNLQEQIFYKDLPFLSHKLGLEFHAALMKGRANYLCLRRWRRFSMQPLFDFAWEGKHFERIRRWSERTKTGDRAEIKGLPEKYSAWNQISCPSHSCLGSKCNDFDSCFVTCMKRKAQDADILVVNHALFFSDLSLRDRAPGVGVIPSYDAVVLDEAHDVEDIATNHFGTSVSTAIIAELVRDAGKMKLPGSEVSSVERALLGINALAAKLFNKLGGPTQGERLTKRHTENIASEAGDLIMSLKQLGSQFENLGKGDDPELARIGERARETATNLEFVIDQPEPEFVYFREARRGWSNLRAAPIDVAPIMKEKLYPQASSVVFTSANLAVAGNFRHFYETMGLEKGTTCHATGTSFDPYKQALLYIPRDLPDPGEGPFIKEASERIKQLVELTRGRAFLLFTSYRAMEETWENLSGQLEGNLLKQGDAPRSELLEEFRSTPSVLFATMSFWQGVDIPGSALSMVIIDKLPFAVPSDPLVQARIELIRSRDKNPFNEYQVPRAVLLLRQGLGRLLRHREDKGVMVLLDRRIHTKGYGRVFRDSLKDHRLTDDFGELRNFIDKEGI